MLLGGSNDTSNPHRSTSAFARVLFEPPDFHPSQQARTWWRCLERERWLLCGLADSESALYSPWVCVLFSSHLECLWWWLSSSSCSRRGILPEHSQGV